MSTGREKGSRWMDLTTTQSMRTRDLQDQPVSGTSFRSKDLFMIGLARSMPGGEDPRELAEAMLTTAASKEEDSGGSGPPLRIVISRRPVYPVEEEDPLILRSVKLADNIDLISETMSISLTSGTTGRYSVSYVCRHILNLNQSCTRSSSSGLILSFDMKYTVPHRPYGGRAGSRLIRLGVVPELYHCILQLGAELSWSLSSPTPDPSLMSAHESATCTPIGPPTTTRPSAWGRLAVHSIPSSDLRALGPVLGLRDCRLVGGAK
ncbi:hypothetical protein DFH07DRAFT_773755 [Mycena maculata]|uniref:Uncharacterized protein n=1 Tax=Mycena maculata TaxID=230809 RepID=A0AAD7J253_9AGAR|nr:hypothetical protein DFH07DRAFT_773755 [Mycena maculata]